MTPKLDPLLFGLIIYLLNFFRNLYRLDLFKKLSFNSKEGSMGTFIFETFFLDLNLSNQSFEELIPECVNLKFFIFNILCIVPSSPKVP